MNFFAGLGAPFTMSDATNASSSSESPEPSSSSSSSSTFSYITTPNPPQQPVASTSSSPSPSSPSTSTDDLFVTPNPDPAVLLDPIVPPPNSFADAQAAMAAQNSSHSQNLIGHRIDNGRLEFVSILGLGAYGVVYLAQDILAPAVPSPRDPRILERPLYAVKCLNKLGLDERQRNFQRREISLHSLASRHPNVVTLYDVIEEPHCIYVILEYCEEGDLFGMITETQRYLGKDELIRSVFLQIVDAVAYCHKQDIYHRDLKPENILCLDDGKKVVLADFGLATSDRNSGDFGCGSTFYMSPECQGGLFQRLGSYQTPHNDIWSLGVILVNLTCGRNPWKQACPSDETFCAYLANPDFLRSILPISEHTNRILKRIFALNPAGRISLKELRQEIVNVKTFVMTEDELRHATRATREAARAFASGREEARAQEAEVEMDTHDDDEEEDPYAGTTEEEQYALASPPISPAPSQAQETESHEPVPTSPSTPTRPNASHSPLTPPTTPRRTLNRPPALMPPMTVPVSGSLSDGGSNGSMSPCGSEGSSDTLGSDDSGDPREVIYTTPPQQSRSIFNPDYNDADLPPTPVSPNAGLRRPRKLGGSRPSSPRGNGPKSNRAGRSVVRKRKGSIDSSSSSSGNSSMPPTPTGPSYDRQHHRHSSSTSSIDYRLAQQVRIVGENESGVPSHYPSEEDMAMANAESNASASSKGSYIAYYPVISDWADASASQQTHYSVSLPASTFHTTTSSPKPQYSSSPRLAFEQSALQTPA